MREGTHMRLARLSLASKDNTFVFINPLMVVAVEIEEECTVVRMFGKNEQSEPLIYRVRERVEVVIHKLEIAANL